MRKKKFKDDKESIFHSVLVMYVLFVIDLAINIDLHLICFLKYVVKILMGGVDSWFDDLDEKKVTTDGYGRPSTNGESKRRKRKCLIQ